MLSFYFTIKDALPATGWFEYKYYMPWYDSNASWFTIGNPSTSGKFMTVGCNTSSPGIFVTYVSGTTYTNSGVNTTGIVTVKYYFSAGAQRIYINNTQKGTSSNSSSQAQSTIPITFGNTASGTQAMRFYFLKLLDSNSLITHYIVPASKGKKFVFYDIKKKKSYLCDRNISIVY